MNRYDFRPGSGPLVISVPHAGTDMPEEIDRCLTALGRSQPDCDWFVDRLYDLPSAAEANVLIARISRYVVDLNRSPDDQSLYPGQNSTGLCSTITFAGEPIYQAGHEPSAAEIKTRVEQYWWPYHQRLQTELQHVIDRHGYAVLLDAHSIASRVPRLFEGTLPDWNFGTNHGASCGSVLSQRLIQFSETIDDATWVINGRFVGGYITRNYGNPLSAGYHLFKHSAAENHSVKATMAGPVFAFQLELSQATYMDESARAWSPGRASKLQRRLTEWLDWLQWIGKE